MIYGIMSDIHSDIKSLGKVIKDMESKNTDKIFCCGDMIGYGNHPQEIIELLRSNNVSCVTGNHEEALFDDLEFTAINRKAQQALLRNKKLLSPSSIEYLEELSESIVHENIRIVHGVPP